MVPKLIILIFFCVSNAIADELPDRAANSLSSENRNFTYGYSLPGKNDAYQGHAEFRAGEHIQGNIVVQHPERESVSDVQYTADAMGFHPVVRLSTKSNHSQVTSHFALGKRAVERLSEQNEKSFDRTSDTGDMKTNRYRSEDGIKDSIAQVLSTLFPDGIPSKYSILMNSTSDFDTDKNIEESTSPKTKEVFKRTKTQNKDFSIERGVRTQYEVPHNTFESSREFVEPIQNLQNIISDEEVLLINHAAENYTDDEVKLPMLATARSYSGNIQVQSLNQNSHDGIIYPFASPIIVADMQNDNLVAPSQENIENFPESPNEIQILPSREGFLNSRTVDPERQINVRILNSEVNEDEIFRRGLLKAATAHDLDAFQKIVEDSFSHSKDFNTEAPSRIFLREFEQNPTTLKNIPISDSDINTFLSDKEDTLGDMRDEDNSEEAQLYFTHPHPLGNKISTPIETESKSMKNGHESNINNATSSTVTSPSRPRGKTFVEIQKAVNIQNLLIKEDADSIERHEEYLQPLASGASLTHRIETKYMKEKPWESAKKEKNNKNPTTPRVSIEPSISYQMENSRNLKSFESRLENFRQNQNFNQQKHSKEQVKLIPTRFFNDDSEEKIVQESQHVGKLHTKVDYDKKPLFQPNFNEEPYKFRQSMATPVIAKNFHHPYTIEKIVEKFVDRPVTVEKIVEKQVKVHVPIKEYVEKIVEKPFEVERIVERHVPVPYLVPIDRFIETPVHVPYPVEQIIEVEKFIDRPVPVQVEKIVDRPYPVEKIVEKIVNRPVHIPVKVPVKVPIPIHVPVQISIPESYIASQLTHITNSAPANQNDAENQNNQQAVLRNFYAAAYNLQRTYPDDINRLMKQKELYNNKQLQQQSRYVKNVDGNDLQASNTLKDEYYGPVPVDSHYSHWGGQQFKRSPDFGRNLRMEYGFKPPLVPSVEIDDQGLPINKKTDS